MKLPSHITATQSKFLNLFQNSKLAKQFYFTGGTALTAFYLPYRFSEDLDFFSEKEFSLEPIVAFLKTNQKILGYDTLDINTSFNRNLIFLKFKDGILKTEFTYFPFPRIEKISQNNLQIDSPLDLAVNKLFTIHQNPRSRDYLDLYMIQKKYHYSLTEVTKKAKIKFDWHIDPLKLGSQFLQCTEVKDYPKLIKPIPDRVWQEYFFKEAKRLGSKILK